MISLTTTNDHYNFRYIIVKTKFNKTFTPQYLNSLEYLGGKGGAEARSSELPMEAWPESL